MMPAAPPPTLADELRQITARELSLPSRLGHVGVLLAASTMTAVVVALLLTEPALPTRTSMALALLGVMGVSWVTLAGWVLTRKRPLLGSHRIIAGRLAVAFCSLFFVGALSVGFGTASAPAFAAAAMGAVMLLIAVAVLIRARRRFAYLSRRRDELARQLGQVAQESAG